MSLQRKEYHRPEDWLRTHQLLNRTDVHTIPLITGARPAALTDLDAEALVDLQSLPMGGIYKDKNSRMHLGSMATLQAIYEDEVLKHEAGGILPEAAYLSATLGLRNLATLAGVISNSAGPQDLTLVLMALEATLEIQQDEGITREMALDEWTQGGAKGLKRGEVLRDVSFAAQPGSKGTLARVGRTPRDHAITAAAAVVEMENGIVRRAGLALAGANPTSVRLFEAEALLIGKPVTPDLLDQAAGLAEKQANPQGDYRGSAAYRRAMASVLSRRALAEACSKAAKA